MKKAVVDAEGHAGADIETPTGWHPIWEALALFAVMMALFAVIQFSTPALIGVDGYYHAKMAWLMREQGLTPEFIWLPLTTLNPQEFVDHHFLYHVYLMPFVFGGPLDGAPHRLVLGIKIANMILPALAFLAIWWLLRAQKVRFAPLWTLGLFAVSDVFLYRMSMTRAQSASLLLLVLGLHLMLTRRYRWLILLGFVFVWFYDAYPMLLVMALVYGGSAFVVDRRIAWQPLAAAAVGIALGMLINPYFPDNITFIVNHIVPKLGADQSQVGNEWYPLDLGTFLVRASGAWAVMVLGVIALAWNRQISRRTLFTLLIAIVFAAMTFKSRRFNEYFPAFALIFGALGIASWLETAARRFSHEVAQMGLAAILAAPLVISMISAFQLTAQTLPHTLYAPAATWLAQNSPPRSLVFQTDWADFPMLFYYNTSDVYTMGLDVTYTEQYDPELYKAWLAIVRGEVEHPGDAIIRKFGAAYVFTNRSFLGFLRAVEGDPHLEQIYQDEKAIIFEVVP